MPEQTPSQPQPGQPDMTAGAPQSPISPAQTPPLGVNPQIQLINGGQLPPQIMAQILQSQMRPGIGVQLQLPGIIQQAQHWQGPYPPPEAVERYEQVLPGTFNRLISMAEQLQQAQIEQSRTALEYSKEDVSRGHWLGFVTTAAAMIGAIVCAGLGQPYVACLFLSVPVMAVAKALVETSKAPSPTDIIKAAQTTQPPQATPPPTQKAGVDK